jgi:hypothetical protein
MDTIAGKLWCQIGPIMGTLEDVFAALAPVESELGRTISPTLYTTTEVKQRRSVRSSFLRQVLEGEHLLLIGEQDDAGNAR